MLEIQTGVTIPVNRNGVNVGELRFNPHDVTFSERIYTMISEFSEAQEKFVKRTAELEADKSEDKYGLPANQRERFALVRELCETTHAKIDEAFGEGTSELVFGGILDPDAIWQFFDGIVPSMDEAQRERIQKYTQKHGNRQQRRVLSKA